MEAYRINKFIACIAMCAVSCNLFSAQENWFSGHVNGTTPVASNSATWNTNETGVVALPSGVTAADGKFTLANDQSTALTLTPTNSQPAISDGIVTIESVALLMPSDATELPNSEAIGTAQAGFAAAVNENNVTNFYGYVGGTWVCLTGADVPESGNTSFKIVLNHRDNKVSFLVKKSDDTYIALASGESKSTELSLGENFTDVASVDCFGVGELTSINTTVEKAVAAVTIDDTTKKYGSVAEALANKGEGTIKDIVVNNDGSVLVPDDPTPADNGLLVWQNDALGIEDNGKIALQPAVHTETAIKLKLADTMKVAAGVTVKFKVMKNGTLVDNTLHDADDISIPLDTGKYTVEPVFSAE